MPSNGNMESILDAVASDLQRDLKIHTLKIVDDLFKDWSWRLKLV